MMNAIKASGKEILLTSIDNDRVILEGIYNGEVLGSACYSAIEGSRLGMMQMINLLDRGKCAGDCVSDKHHGYG